MATEIRGQAARRQVKQRAIASALGLSEMAVSRRMNGHTPFEVGELVTVARVLGCEVTALLPLPEQRSSSVTRQYLRTGTVLQLPPNTIEAVEREHLAPVIDLADRRAGGNGRMSSHRHDCPECGAAVLSDAKYHARQRARCRACIRRANGWACRVCGSDDPYHDSPCPIGG